MSSTILKLISTTPSYVPTEVQFNEVKALLSHYYVGMQITYQQEDTVVFIDQGENFERVSCPLCQQVMALDDWQEAMESAFQTQFEDLDFTTRCCGQLVSLNDLTYEAPAGFARFQIGITNPSEELNPEQISQLEACLATVLKVIWAHY